MSGADLARLRAEARGLLDGIRAGDRPVLDRVLSSHPNYAGRDPARLDPRALGLLDAQATVAAEAGFASWADLVDSADQAITGHPRPRWNDRTPGPQYQAMRLAVELGHPALRLGHIVLAVLRSGAHSAIRALEQLGVDEPTIRGRLGPDPAAGNEKRSVTSTDEWHCVVGWATGLALGRGADQPGPEDVLLALAYAAPAATLRSETGLDPGQIHAALAAAGHPVPALPPGNPA